MQYDFALWLRSSSPSPDIVELRDVGPELTVFDAVLLLMQEHKETYVSKAVVNTPYGLQRLWRVSLSLEVPACQTSALKVVKHLWSRLVADGLNPVEVSSLDALAILREYAACEPAGVLSTWEQATLSVDLRLFADFWNGRRSFEARMRLLSEEESEVPHSDVA